MAGCSAVDQASDLAGRERRSGDADETEFVENLLVDRGVGQTGGLQVAMPAFHEHVEGLVEERDDLAHHPHRFTPVERGGADEMIEEIVERGIPWAIGRHSPVSVTVIRTHVHDSARIRAESRDMSEHQAVEAPFSTLGTTPTRVGGVVERLSSRGGGLHS